MQQSAAATAIKQPYERGHLMRSEQLARCYAKQRMLSVLQYCSLQGLQVLVPDKEPVMSKIGGHLTCPRTPVS